MAWADVAKAAEAETSDAHMKVQDEELKSNGDTTAEIGGHPTCAATADTPDGAPDAVMYNDQYWDKMSKLLHGPLCDAGTAWSTSRWPMGVRPRG